MFQKYNWAIAIILFITVVYTAMFLRYRIDLTAEKRFSLTKSTKQLLQQLEEPVTIKVFLSGELPADYKKLSIATNDLLASFRDVSNNKVHFTFENIGNDLNDTAKAIIYDSLLRMGVVFERTEIVSEKDAKATQQMVIPSAVVYYKDKKPLAIDLRNSRTIFKQHDVLNDIQQEDKEATRNGAEALLEFKFANTIDKLTRSYVPSIAYLVGNGEPVDLSVNDIGESLRNDYRLAVFNLKQGYPRPADIDALLIVKPTQPFTEEDKLKLDQYVMHGGKVIWFVDKLYAELDSLMRSRADFIAFDRNLNIDDILFKYGVRINGDLLQDLNCSKIPMVTGMNPDGSPRMQRIPWPYYPFLSVNNNNPVSKNVGNVLPVFPSSIDTVKAEGITKTILLASDTNSRVLSSPAMVSLNSVQNAEAFRSFNKSFVPVAVLLEGQFSSFFANRLSPQMRDSVTAALGMPFLPKAEKPTKQIVVSDADIVTNAVSKTTGPFPMGMLPFENYRFANHDFFMNSIDYLIGNNGLFEARNKEFTLRLLDKHKVEANKTTWQMINVVLPIFLIILFGGIFNILRKKKYVNSAIQ